MGYFFRDEEFFYMLTIDRKFYTWHELVEKFPNQWIVAKDAELTDAGFIKSDRLIGMCDNTELQPINRLSVCWVQAPICLYGVGVRNY